MDELIIYICQATFHDEPAMIKRCSVGLANYVFIVEIKGSKYTVRLSTEKHAYNDTVRLLGKLMEMGIAGRDGEDDLFLNEAHRKRFEEVFGGPCKRLMQDERRKQKKKCNEDRVLF